MKKLISVLLCLAMMFTLVSFAAAEGNPYDVTEPITIQWWHAHEDRFTPAMEYMVAKFNETHPLITVEPVYMGGYSDINTQLIAANASGEVPAVCTCNTSYPPQYGAAGICEDLTPYIEAYGYDAADFGEGLLKATSYEGQQICLPYLISTQVLYYNKTVADELNVEMPKTFDQMDEFLEKVTLFNDDGTTARYGIAIGGWDYWYYEMLYKNNGVEVVTDDNTTDIAGEKSVEITKKIKEWIDKGYAYYAYGTDASSTMRQNFWDGKIFCVTHTSSLYDTYVEKANGFEVGMAWLPGGTDGETFKSEVGGSAILIPAKASQAQKNAAWQFIMFMTSPEINLYWADQTGYFPTRQSVLETDEVKDYLTRKPAMANVMEMSGWINPRNSNPAYDTCANLWRNSLALIFNEGAPVESTLEDLAAEITENLEDQ